MRVGKSRKRLLFALLMLPAAVVLARVLWTEEPPAADATQTAFEHMAARLPYLALSCVLYDRDEHLFVAANDRDRVEHFAILTEATDRAHPRESLVRLLKHSDPKVRTLAAVALFDREDPFVLPAFAELSDDRAPTFDGHPDISREWLRYTGIGPPARSQTVGDVAAGMVRFYLDSGYADGEAHDPVAGRFQEYWEDRKHRSFCTSWFCVQLARAVGRGSSVEADVASSVRGLRERIDALPPDDRAWVLLRLHGEMGGDVLVSENDLIEACKELGPGKLLLMLEGRIPSDDPDLRPRMPGSWPYQGMVLFVLNHAEALLRPEDGAALLACEAGNRAPDWALAASDLDPGNASSILHAAFDRFQGEFDADEQSRICAALWRHGGAAELEFVVDWFYAPKPERATLLLGEASFVRLIGPGADARTPVARIVMDDRFEAVKWSALEELVRWVNGWVLRPVVAPDEIEGIRYPMTAQQFESTQAKAEEQYPNETAELRRTLQDWRDRLRASVPDWSPGE